MTEQMGEGGFSLDAMLAKVQGLLAVADDPATTPQAAENYRQKAEALMFKYRIEETMLNLRQPANPFRPKPVWKTFRIARHDNEWRDYYQNIALSSLGHVDARCVVDLEASSDGGEYWQVIHAVAYESDLRFAEVIFTAGMLAFGTKLEPKVNPSLSDQENAYHLRNAGMEGHRIAMALWGKDDKALRIKARAMHRKEAEARGESVDGLTGRGVNVKAFRDSYAQGFASEFWSRLWRMRMEHAEDERGLVLASRKDEIQEALYERFPHLRPKAPDPNAERYVSPDEKCERCKRAKSGYCREHSYLRPSQARPRYASYSDSGARRGREAARTVDFGAQQAKRAPASDRRSLGG